MKTKPIPFWVDTPTHPRAVHTGGIDIDEYIRKTRPRSKAEKVVLDATLMGLAVLVVISLENVLSL